MAIHQNTETMK